MRSSFKSIAIIILLALFNQCQYKSVQLELEETACKNFKISNPSYTWVNNITPCGGNVKTILSVTFDYSGDRNCIDKIQFSPVFYKSDNSTISNVQFQALLNKSDANVIITNTSITIKDTIVFASTSDANALNFIHLTLNTENQVQSKSNKLEMRVNTPCSGPGNYNRSTTVTVTENTFDLYLNDYADEDGDIVSVYLNGSWIIENYTLTNAGKTFYNIPLVSGNNDLVIVANNTGKSGPNTCGVKVNEGTTFQMNPSLQTGDAVRIIL